MSKIEWCDLTINPVVGCSKCSPGCENCYAERFAARMAKHPNPKIREKYAETVDANGRWTGKINIDLSCLAQIQKLKSPKLIFLTSMGDIFHPAVPFSVIDLIVSVVELMPQHTFIFLTKRVDRMYEYFEAPRKDDLVDVGNYTRYEIEDITRAEHKSDRQWRHFSGVPGWQVIRPERPLVWPIPNLILMATICNQEEAEQKIPKLLSISAATRGVSIEPMLGLVDLSKHLVRFRCWGCESESLVPVENCVCPQCGGVRLGNQHYSPGLDWVICGGETGPGARPVHPYWAYSLRDQCAKADIHFFFKSWGAWLPVDEVQEPIFCEPNGVITIDGRYCDYSKQKDTEEFWDKPDSICLIDLRKKKKKYRNEVKDLIAGQKWDEVPV